MVRASSESQKISEITKNFPPEVEKIDEKLKQSPQDAELWFSRGLALGNERLMRDAVKSFSRAIALDPSCGIYYRWRGHRHLNLAEIPEACADLVVASRLIPENWDVWYHLGLTHVLLGNYQLAELAYKKCAFVPSERSTNIIPLTNWTYVNLMLQGKREEALEALKAVPDDMIANDYNADYLEMINFYKGKAKAEELLVIPDGLSPAERDERIFSICTHGFGLANHFYGLGDKEAYHKIIDYVLDIGKDVAWNSFGFAGAYYTKTYRGM
ncbi:MAG: hypothetical protein IAA97_05090 [Spirochaetes bacterium]|uniref:Tetratricopeptide repeat protein n=1 Tax=Candidatus Ornithospirochaeta stercoripullorum TaxID=2840899 RepID=A0A9D9E0R6_9SPIO|nr:hypothetical protein [Candidatus Ornithospirochaeta stercoripullorum]